MPALRRFYVTRHCLHPRRSWDRRPLITVEVHISNGLPGLTMVGLPETTVREARDRVRSAIINSGYAWPAKKITINLAPADLPKEGEDMIYLSLSRFWWPLSS